MSDGYFKAFNSMLDSSLWRLDSDSIKVFLTMLHMVGRDGVVRASVLGISDRARLDLVATERALALFQEPDPYSTNPDNEGRRIRRHAEGWHVLNYQHYRDRKTLGQQAGNARVQQHRERKKQERNETIETPEAIRDELQLAGTLCNELKRDVTPVTTDEDEDEEADENADAETEGSASAFSSALRLSVSAGDGYRRELWQRMRRVVMHKAGEESEGRDPPWYLPWWREVSRRVVDAGGIGELDEWVTYLEDCRDPAKSVRKGLGTMTPPSKWLAKRARDFLAPKGLKLPKAPKNEALVRK